MTTKYLHIGSTSDFLELVPILLGYTPENALVLHGITLTGTPGPAMAIPLPNDPTTWRQLSREAPAEFFAATDEHGIAIRNIAAILYRDPQPGTDPHTTAHLLQDIATWLTDDFADYSPATVKVALGVIGNQWWDYHCHRPGCCDGNPLPRGNHPESVTAQLHALGYTPGPPSSQIKAEFTPNHDEDTAGRYRSALTRASAHLKKNFHTERDELRLRQDTVRSVAKALQTIREGGTLNNDMAAHLLLDISDRHTRDRVLSHGPDEDLPHERNLWADLARRCPRPDRDLAPAPLTLFAWVAWRQNDHPAARHALQAALAINSEYALAKLLHSAMNRHIPACEFLSICRTLMREEEAKDEAALRDR